MTAYMMDVEAAKPSKSKQAPAKTPLSHSNSDRVIYTVAKTAYR
jgi:hypothetical protein